MTSTISESEPASAPAASLAANASALFVGQAIGLIVPLLTIPYLARVLGPAAWGPIIAAQALGNWLLLLVDFGFELSGTRAIARARTGPGSMDDIVHGVRSAQVVLAASAGAIALVVCLFVPSLRLGPAFIGWTVAFAVLRGVSPLWFFQGLERVRGAVAVDAITKALAALGVFVVVRGPHDAVRVLELQALFAAIALVVLTVWMRRHVPLRFPGFGAAIGTIKETRYVFACRASSGLYVQANTLILSALASPVAVAFFGGSERIVRAAINLLQPLTQAFLPRISFLQASDRGTAHRTIRDAMLVVGGLGLLFSACAVIGAPILVRIVLGADYLDAVPLLRVLGVLPLLVALSTVLGLYWALPFNHEKLFLASILGAGVMNVMLAFLLVPHLGGIGMAIAALGAESVVLIVLAVGYLRSER